MPVASDILIVDDEDDIRALIAGILEDEGYDTRQAADADEALAKVNDRVPGLLILDIWLQNSTIDGLEILDRVKQAHASLPVIMISGHGTIKTAVNAIKRGAYDFIEKPFKADRLLLLVRRAVEAARLKRENAELLRKAGSTNELIGGSQGLGQVRSAIEKVAPTNSRVLITGPAGAGKEVVAGMIHTRSGRMDGPMIVLNCATLNPERLETELFGTAASAEQSSGISSVGVFERAHKGTLFLDEVADMPLETQGKIVRVLQEQRFRRVGGKTEVSVDVRVIASTNRDLQREISAGRFREDLFFRLAVLGLRIPPLRERKEDFPSLVRVLCEKLGPNIKVSEEALFVLEGHTFPGNVRELRNVLTRAFVLGGPQIDASTIRFSPWATPPGTLDHSADVLHSTERSILREAFQRFDGNRSAMARELGVPRTTLHYKLRRFGIAN